MQDVGNWILLIVIIIIVSITKCSIVIGSLRTYLIHNWRVITWVSNYSCPWPIWTFCNQAVIGQLSCVRINQVHWKGFFLWVAPQLLTTSYFIEPWYHAALLFSGLGSILLLFGVLFSQQIREDLVRAATSPLFIAVSPLLAKVIIKNISRRHRFSNLAYCCRYD